MKKIIYIFSFVFLGTSCGDSFLDTDNLTKKTAETFYKNNADVRMALNAIYNQVSPASIMEFSFVVGEIKCGDRFPGGGPDDAAALAIGQFNDLYDDTFLDTWAQNYRGIYRTNMLLENFKNAKFDSTAQASKAEGEAHFLRAYFYFDLAKLFGTVPLVLSTEKQNLPKATEEALYAQIALDLKTAIEKLPSTAYSTGDIGRTTKWAAEGYLARVFLFYTGVYHKAALPLPDGGSITRDQVIECIDDCVEHSGHSLVADFRNLWPYSYCKDYAYAKDNSLSWVGEEGGNTEAMFSIRFSSTASWDNYYSYSNNQMDLFFGWRAQDQIPFGQGYGYGPVNPDMWTDWSDNDIRKKASICDVNDATEGLSGYEWGGDNQCQETGYWQKKYMPINILNGNGEAENMSISLYHAPNDFMLNNTQEIVLLRFADVLLMGAELGSTHAQEYLDDVRSRVNLPSVPPTLDNIKQERRCELAFEGVRYYDLLRWGDAETEINKVNKVPVKNSDADATFSTTFRTETKGFVKIPVSQIQLSNGVLKQNAGW